MTINQTVCSLLTMHVPWPWLRQTEDGAGNMDGVFFLLNEISPQTQWLAVVDEPFAEIATPIPIPRRVLFITEPPEVKVYPQEFLRQFGIIVSPYAIGGVASESILVENPCVTWQYGVDAPSQSSFMQSLSDIRQMPVPSKSKLLSVICSTKAFTQAQRNRLAFVEKLQVCFGSRVDVFGRGRNPVSDKQIAIAPYKYHLVLENNYIANFWTEKLTDSWLGYAYAVYLGAPNIEGICPSGGLLALEPDNDEANLDAIARLLYEDPWQRALPAIRQCRQWAIEANNVFSRVARIIRESASQRVALPNLKKADVLRPSCRWKRALLRRAMKFGLWPSFAR